MEHLTQLLDQRSPKFNTVSPRHLLTDALYQMCAENLDYLVVLESEQFVGLLTEHDITKNLLFAEKPLSELKVAEVMNCKLPVANAHDSVEYAMQLFDRYNTRYMAIYDGFTFRGVVSENELVKCMLQHQLQEQTGVEAYPWNY